MTDTRGDLRSGLRSDLRAGGAARAPARRWPVSRPLLWAEFALLYLALPVLIAVRLPPQQMFAALFAVTVLGLGLLWRTPGFSLRELTRGMEEVRLLPLALLALVTFAASWVILDQTRPGALFALPRERPLMLAVIVVLYPVLSALPQELLFRPLFFRRYGTLLPRRPLALVLNAALFSLAHLMYWHWIVAAMTFVGGLIFAWAYEVRRSFPLALALHSVAGCVLFAAGMGVYFYSGNVVRPF